MNTKHTPTPWNVRDFSESCTRTVVEYQCKRVARCDTTADAAHIVKCVNAHDALVAALKFAKESIVHNSALDEARLNEAMVAVENRITSALSAAGEAP